jgi:hypothetical protein
MWWKPAESGRFDDDAFRMQLIGQSRDQFWGNLDAMWWKCQWDSDPMLSLSAASSEGRQCNNNRLGKIPISNITFESTTNISYYIQADLYN